MIQKIIAFSIRHKFIIALLTLALIGAGIHSMLTINLGSVPDITNNQVQVITVSPNLATEDIEQFVTYPVELAMGNLPGVQEIRSISRFGLSVVTIVFKDEQGTYLPRQLVQEKLNELQEQIPERFGQPAMGPISTGLGQIYEYTIEPEPEFETKYTPVELRTIQDWIVKRQLTLLEGVVEVNSFGGGIKQYEVSINPERLNAMHVTLAQVYEALAKNNVNTGGAYIEKNKMANFIRGEGLIKSLDDIRKIVVSENNGIPVMINDVAEEVHFGQQVRYGAFTKDGKEAVGGIIMMLKDSNPKAVIDRVKQRMTEVEQSLPEGLKIHAFIDRSALIGRTTQTLTHNLLEGALIVIFALVFLLGSVRGGLITATTIPLSLLFAFVLMKQFNVWANLMSLGAIDFGIIIDGAVIIIEGTVYEIQKRIKAGGTTFNGKTMDALAEEAGGTMMGSAFFGQVIILIVFAPILFLTGVEGKMFQPMAYTFGFAMIGAILLCLTYVPMMSALLMRPVSSHSWWGKVEHALESLSDRIISVVQKSYLLVLRGALRFKKIVVVAAVVLLGVAIALFSQMGGEFAPQLDEGDLAMQALIRPGSSLTESIDISKRIETLLMTEFPEIETVTARIGVADIPTDPMPMDIADMYIILDKNKDNWTSAKDKETLVNKIKTTLETHLTGVNFVFTQPVELRFNELLEGVREDIAVKLYGEDLDVLAKKVDEMAALIRTVPGVGDVSPERISGLPQMTVRYDRRKIAQYGLNIEKLNDYVSSAFAGGVAGVIFEGEKRFDLVVRFDEAHRKGIDDLQNLYIDLPDGIQIPIKEVADISYQPGPMQISREDTYRRTYVGVNVRGRDVESVVADIQHKLKEALALPAGYYISYGGTFENLQSAKDRLMVVVPIALFLIFVMLYFALQSFTQSFMIYMAIPLAAIGGVFALLLRGMPFSISAGVGFIVLFGVAVLNGLVLINRFNTLKSEGISNVRDRIILGTKERIRPILLTATTDIFGFLPMAFSQSAGAEVQQPLATVVIGGMVTATLLTLIVLPVLYALTEARQQSQQGGMKPVIAVIVVLSVIGIPLKTMSQQMPVQKTLTMEAAQSMAVQRYPKVKAARLAVDGAQALKKTAIDLGSTQLFTGKEEAGNGEAGNKTPWGIQQQQIDVFGIAPKTKLRKAEIDLAKIDVALTEVEIKRAVAHSWAAVVVQEKKYQLFQKLDSSFSSLKKAARVRLETETSSRLEYLSTVNQANQIVIEKNQMYHDYIMALQQFNQWFATTDTLYVVPEINMDSSIQQSIVQLPDTLMYHPTLERAQQQVDVADRNVRVQSSQFLPQFQAQYAQQEIDGISGYYQYQVGIQIPLWFGPVLGRKQYAEVQRDIASQHSRQTLLETQTAYAQAKEAYLKWYDAWQFYREETLPLAREQRDGAILSFQEGAIDYVTFLQNIRDAIQIELEAWTAYENFLYSYNEVLYFVGHTSQIDQ